MIEKPHSNLEPNYLRALSLSLSYAKLSIRTCARADISIRTWEVDYARAETRFTGSQLIHYIYTWVVAWVRALLHYAYAPSVFVRLHISRACACACERDSASSSALSSPSISLCLSLSCSRSPRALYIPSAGITDARGGI